MSLRLTAGVLALFAPVLYSQVGSMTMAATAFVGQVVTGAPYSAQEVMEHTQTLADGTHITQKPRTTLLFRDSQGRTRTERQMFFGPNEDTNIPIIIQIKDPVAGFQYTLDPQDHVAHRVSLTRPGSIATGTGTADAVPKISTTPPPPPPPQRAAGTVRVPTDEFMGTQTMEGVTVEGHRTTITTPIGKDGNDRPLVSTFENWRSPDLKITVLSKNFDPRNGETITRLTNIVVSEPDPALFQPPADYTIVDEKGPFTIHFTPPPPQ